MRLALILLLAYFAGSINFAIIILSLLGKEDPRTRFSGNAGTTNVCRQAGKGWAAIVLILDAGRAVGLAALALWIFFAFFMALGARLAADIVAPMPTGASMNAEAVLKNDQVRSAVARISPITLYSEATSTVLDPLRKTTRSLVLMGPMEQLSISRFQNPLPLEQSALIVMPHLVSLLAITLLCFGVCYLCFMRQEVRST